MPAGVVARMSVTIFDDALPVDGDVAGYGPPSFCGEAAVVLATVKDARRRFAVAFGHP